jgi:hypothetical protein
MVSPPEEIFTFAWMAMFLIMRQESSCQLRQPLASLLSVTISLIQGNHDETAES